MSRGTSICYQFNVEYLTQVVWSNEVDGQRFALPVTLIQYRFTTQIQIPSATHL
ncbi:MULTISPECIES: hypothetical protein [Acinetobacter]|uniref:hypothetical protein n=1 Tax=Acinetobacter TaxID=469 RepID=UPI000A9841D6|nr:MULTISPECIES: hypothetical protein [Acinetobacter]NAR79856.1 hypothetical protein [Acinetobacter haemolyticus]NAR90845.1 hypothetical protein [Acinetobacter haemolyticus]NAR94876.1 hypothetical protein [Acinetobacter haemolyticus]